MDTSTRQLILYACPTGPLATQIEDYFQESQRRWGPNKAHQYMPHCTLTGFFHDKQEAIALYRQTLEKVISSIAKPSIPIQITDLLFRDGWHGLALESSWLQTLSQSFAQEANSATRTENLRLKTWLHVSLAYGFAPTHTDGLKQLAIERVDPNATVEWEIRFYERLPQKWQSQRSSKISSKMATEMASTQWICHGRWRVY